MKYEIVPTGANTTLKLIGEVVASDKGSFASVVAEAAGGGRPIQVDMSDLGYMDSAGLAFLLNLWQAASEKNLAVSIAGAAGEVKALLELSDFSVLYKME